MNQASADFDEFYRANFRDTAGLIYGFTGDLGEAQDLAQEAFCRAWRNWSSISAYDEPGAWVRRVATNLARSRWRRMRIATAHLFHHRVEHELPPDPDHVAVVAALRKLPKAQREALVLHYIADMSVEDVARQLDAPVGTVKSWLHRGRAALAGELALDVPASLTPPPAEQLVAAARRHQRARTATVTTTAVVVLVALLAFLTSLRPLRQPMPIEPTPSPSLSIVDPNDPILSVDWSKLTIAIDKARPGCPSGQVATWKQTYPRADFEPLSYGDMTGDGRGEALVSVICTAAPQATPTDPALLLVRLSDDGHLHGIGWMDYPSGWSPWIAGGVLHIPPPPPSDTVPVAPFRVGEVDGYRWTGDGFTKIDTLRWYPAITELDLNPVADRLPCPSNGIDMRLTFTDGVLDSGRIYWAFSDDGPIYAELGRIGRPYLILRVNCLVAESTLIVFDYIAGVWTALATLRHTPFDRYYRPAAVNGRVLTVEVHDYDPGGDVALVSFTWVGNEFIPTG